MLSKIRPVHAGMDLLVMLHTCLKAQYVDLQRRAVSQHVKIMFVLAIDPKLGSGGGSGGGDTGGGDTGGGDTGGSGSSGVVVEVIAEVKVPLRPLLILQAYLF